MFSLMLSGSLQHNRFYHEADVKFHVVIIYVRHCIKCLGLTVFSILHSSFVQQLSILVLSFFCHIVNPIIHSPIAFVCSLQFAITYSHAGLMVSAHSRALQR